MSLLWIAALLYFLAVLLAFVDLFLPSGGALMLLGGMSAVASIAVAFQQSALAGSVVLLVVLATIPVFGLLAVRVWPHTPIGRRVIMQPPKRSIEQDALARKHSEETEALIGRVFVADADLMPSGTIVVDGKSLNAMAESGFIEAGQTCEIIGYRERQFVVRLTKKTLPESVARPASEGLLDQPDTLVNADPSLLDVPAEQFGLDSLGGEDPDEDSVKRV